MTDPQTQPDLVLESVCSLGLTSGWCGRVSLATWQQESCLGWARAGRWPPCLWNCSSWLRGALPAHPLLLCEAPRFWGEQLQLRASPSGGRDPWLLCEPEELTLSFSFRSRTRVCPCLPTHSERPTYKHRVFISLYYLRPQRMPYFS